jgi:hypothetical protein
MKRFLIAMLLISCTSPQSGPAPNPEPEPLKVTSLEQAIELARENEQQHYERIYGADKPHPPLATASKPNSTAEKEYKGHPYYEIIYSKPFLPVGGGYVKTFRVFKRTGQVTRSFQLGR